MTNIKIPKKHYKVLLVQLMIKFISALMFTFKGKNSLRYELAEICEASLKDLERELKRDVTLAEASVVKKSLFDCLYIGKIPDWFERVFKEAVREESVKLEEKKKKEIQDFWLEGKDV